MALLWNRSLAREINRRKQIEAALVQARDKLEADAQALDQQSAQLKTMNENLIRANKDLESFSYSVSHDLKAPVRHIENFSELLELHTKNTLDEEGKEFLSKVRAEARRMHELIEALLRFARIGHARMKREPVNFETLTKEVIESAKFEAAGRRIEWELHSMPTVECDRELMKEVLANLVRNAVKFSRNRDPARIEIGTLPATDEGEAVIVYVKDNGAGFDPALAGTLFKSFHRLHSQQEFEGSGIGLANVSRIIERHGGRVWAEGMVDKGAKFYFSLAKRKPQETETEFTRRVEKR
jgi:light-regulated signal transduction histidine kinase (bacteriophytochrome)